LRSPVVRKGSVGWGKEEKGRTSKKKSPKRMRKDWDITKKKSGKAEKPPGLSCEKEREGCKKTPGKRNLGRGKS